MGQDLTLADIVARTFRKNVSWRVYGPNKEFRRPMIHKYPAATGQTVLDIMADNVTRNNALLQALMKNKERT